MGRSDFKSRDSLPRSQDTSTKTDERPSENSRLQDQIKNLESNNKELIKELVSLKSKVSDKSSKAEMKNLDLAKEVDELKEQLRRLRA